MKRLAVVTPANQVPGPEQGYWDYHSYAALPDDGQRYEVVDGVLYITPAPGTFHQKVVLKIARQFLVLIEDVKLSKTLSISLRVFLLNR